MTEAEIKFFHARLPDLGFPREAWYTIWESEFQLARMRLWTRDLLKNDQNILPKGPVSGSGQLSQLYLPTPNPQPKDHIPLGRIVCSWWPLTFSKEVDHMQSNPQKNLGVWITSFFRLNLTYTFIPKRSQDERKRCENLYWVCQNANTHPNTLKCHIGWSLMTEDNK